ncbi:MAG TPA: anti-sigma factor [Silvibacterium sp.]|nr:anti-sigma factor [Silvibacterium sp.]
MTCSEFLAHLDDLIDNTISVPMRTELEEHLRGCEHCVITLNTTRKTIEIYRRHAIYELPNDLRERLQQAILAKCKKC